MFEISKGTIDQLFRDSLQYSRREQFQRFISFVAKFNHYSRFHTMIVWLQNKNITFFGSTSFWKNKFGRTILPDAKPYIILAPMGPVMLVNDVMQTNGKLPPEQFLQEGSLIHFFHVSGQYKEEYLTALTSFCIDHGFKVLIKDLNFFNGGAITTILSGKKEIVLKAGHSDKVHFTTLCHELAHLFLGHTGHVALEQNDDKKKKKKLPVRKLPLKAAEAEAETVSFLVCNSLGLETSSIAYLASYIKNENDWVSFSYENVISVSDKITSIVKSYKPKERQSSLSL